MKLIALSGKGKGLYAQVDDEDYERLIKYSWYMRKSGNCVYAYGRLKNTKQLVHMHRLIIELNSSGLCIDHIDHNGLNNQRDNLRIVTASQNQANSHRHVNSKTFSSKYKGVYYGKSKNKMYWVANCRCLDEKRVKFYNTEVEAAISYNEMALDMHGEFACCNTLTEEDTVEYNKILEFRKSIEGKSYCKGCDKYLLYNEFGKGIPGKCKDDGCRSMCRKCEYQYNKERKIKIKCSIQQ